MALSRLDRGNSPAHTAGASRNGLLKLTMVKRTAGLEVCPGRMEDSGRTLSSYLHFPFVQKPDAPAAGLTSSQGRIRPGWGNPLLDGEKGKEEFGRRTTRTSLIAFLALSLVILIIDRPVLEPPVLDAAHTHTCAKHL